MTTNPETPTAPPVPDLEAPKVFKRVLAARRLVTETTERATVAYREAEEARTHLTAVEAEYAAVKTGEAA